MTKNFVPEPILLIIDVLRRVKNVSFTSCRVFLSKAESFIPVACGMDFVIFEILSMILVEHIS